MKCKKCKQDMILIGVNDDPNIGYAYNIYHCLDCMIVCCENVWKNKGEFWVFVPDHTHNI